MVLVPDEDERPDEGRPVRRFLVRTVQGALLAAVATVAASLAGELLVRAVAPQQLIMIRPDIWAPADTLGWTHRANLDTRVNTGERSVRLVTDRRGFRISPAGHVDAHPRVLLIGDSYMAALQVEYEQSFAGLMETELSEMLGTPVTVMNTGVGAWDASHYLLMARKALSVDPPDLMVVAVYLGNDLVTERREAFRPVELVEHSELRWPRRLTADELVDAVARPINDRLETTSHLFVLGKTSLGSVLMRLGLTARYIPPELREDQRDWAAWDVTADVLAEIDALARDRGVPAIFALIPSNYQVDPELLRSHARALGLDPSTLDPEQPNRILGGALLDRGLAVVDLLPAFRSAHQAGDVLYGRIDPHFAPDGHREMWRAMGPYVAEILTCGEPGYAARDCLPRLETGPSS